MSKFKVNPNKGTSNSSGFQSSVNNDWTNWLVLHGNAKEANDDVRGIGKAVGLKFNGDKIICLMFCLGREEKIRKE